MRIIRTIITSATIGMAFCIGIAFGAETNAVFRRPGPEIMAAQQSITEAIIHLENAGQNDTETDWGRIRALAYLSLAREELQAGTAIIRPLNQ